MNAKGRPILGAISGLFAGLFIGIDLFLLGIVESDSAVILILPIVFLLIGIALGITAPIKRGAKSDPETEDPSVNETAGTNAFIDGLVDDADALRDTPE